ncbi:MAG: hypothetical protein H6644_09880 [Caldilineaceae bacterium]|nr:hypothetical protein [Caldilineaceae bacterium]
MSVKTMTSKPLLSFSITPPITYTPEEAFRIYWHPESEPRIIPGLKETGQTSPNCLRFHLKAVYCQDETDPEFGEDEIHLAAVCVDGAGRIEKVGQFKIGDFEEDDKKEVKYPGSGKILTHSVFVGAGWPQKFLMYLTLLEADMGGDNAVNTVKEYVSEAFAAAKVSGSEPIVIAADILEKISKYVFMGLDAYKDDDLFPTQLVSITIPSPAAKWRKSNGAIVSHEYFWLT